ncbi:hypothetical protein ACJZ2D_017054 [Fusarium nematophilum]
MFLRTLRYWLYCSTTARTGDTIILDEAGKKYLLREDIIKQEDIIYEGLVSAAPHPPPHPELRYLSKRDSVAVLRMTSEQLKNRISEQKAEIEVDHELDSWFDVEEAVPGMVLKIRGHLERLGWLRKEKDVRSSAQE